MTDQVNCPAFVTVTCRDDNIATTLARIIEEHLRRLGFHETRQLAPDVKNRAIGLFPVEIDRIATMGDKTFVVITSSRGSTKKG